MIGQQTAAGDPDVPLTDYYDAGCCPEGIIPFYNSKEDNCCVDTFAKSPYA